ncbi:MAG: hypothetical protein CMJ59_03935 [Planctomycetaceae bacterium]|nr:hypothetical protein [Planctomycetaceae bacterium]
MHHDPASADNRASLTRHWSPMNPTERRVFGVLIEKAKTTPDVYPLTLNATTTACNQKNNRVPQTNYTSDDVQQALDSLRQLGAVTEVQTGSQTSKYKHYAYDWLGVDKTEVAVVAELLLRGSQTLGDLRGRTARMESIADLAALRPVLDSLIVKELVIELSPAGRGQMVTHGLYPAEEMKQLRARAPGTSGAETVVQPSADPAGGRVAKLEAELAELRDRVTLLENRLTQ